jgi:hypothetical protein
MTDNGNEVTVDNSVLILIDHQPWVPDVPVIPTTVGAEGGKLRDPLMRAVADVFPDKTPIDRPSTNAWADIRQAVEATGRKTLKNGAGVGLALEQAFAQS